MARKIQIAVGEHYHIVNRATFNRNLFRDDRDYIRFLLLILFFQSPITLTNLNRPVSHFVKHLVFNIKPDLIEKIIRQRQVRLRAFGLMPDHYHLLLQEVKSGGIASFMQRIGNAYAKYSNAKYGVAGHLFQSTYRAVHIKDNEQLLYTSAYIHKNPKELKRWANRPEQCPWSSYQDYIGRNRWGKLLDTSLILDQFKTQEDYHNWVRQTVAKELLDT